MFGDDFGAQRSAHGRRLAKGFVGVPDVCGGRRIALLVVIDDQLGGVGAAGGKGVNAQGAETAAKASQVFRGNHLIRKDQHAMLSMGQFEGLDRGVVQRLAEVDAGDACAQKNANSANFQC